MRNLLSSLFILVFLASCTKETIPLKAVYNDEKFVFPKLETLPLPKIPSDNLLTKEKVKLGKMLFFENKLSKDNSINCASCHVNTFGFSDTNKFSIGVNHALGKRQSMATFNLAWTPKDFFWDGRAEKLRDQVLMPIQDPLEMNETLENVVSKLRDDSEYKNQFIRAFGSDEINTEKMALALEQFLFTIVSNKSKYDEYLKGNIQLTESEERGRQLFFEDYNPAFPESSGADCAHCHGGPNFTNNSFMNNGLDKMFEVQDLGREIVTKNTEDRAKFKVTSLRNIELTAPYMHDGRFNTLEEVVDHYNSGIKKSYSLDITLKGVANTGLFLNDKDKKDLVNFLKTLTDYELLKNPAYQKL